jgi:phospholipid/cholesterol/gamma-HCH transport system substrate-binding protein
MSPALKRSRTTRRRRGMHPLVITALMIAATVFIVYYAFNQGLPLVHKFTLSTIVNNSVNVRADSPVRIAGIDVGTVSGVSPDGNASRITFTVDDNGQPIHSDATIRIRTRLFLEGGYYLDVDPGSPSAPIIKDGGRIPESQTATPVQFYNLLSTFDSAARTSLENTLNTLNQGFSAQLGQPQSDSGAGGLKTAIPQFTPVLKDVAWVTRALRGTQAGDVENVLSSTSDITTTLARNSAQLADLVTGLNTTSSALAAADGSLSQSIAGLDQTLQVAPAALTAIDRSLPPVANLATTLDPSLKVAPPLVDGLTKAVTQLGTIVAPATRGRLLDSLTATFEQFPALLTKLATVFPYTKEVTDCLRTHVTPILNHVVPDGKLTTNQPVWQEFVHFLGGIASSGQNFDANGNWIRLEAGVGTNALSLGNLPIIGQLLSTPPSGGTAIQGASPHWVGDLQPSAYQPGVACTSQALPSLASPAAAPDTTRAATAAPGHLLDSSTLSTDVARRQKAVNRP